MLSLHDLKSWLSRDLPNGTKLLVILSTFDTPQPVAVIVARGAEAGNSTLAKCNPSTTLTRMKGLALKVPDGWEISDSGRQYLVKLGVTELGVAARVVSVELRQHLPKIANDDVRVFLDEAIACFEGKLFRSAVVMSWLAAVAVLYSFVVSHHLAAFNAEACRVDSRWRAAVTTDDLSRMKESDFLDRLASVSIIGKNAKEQLKARLDFRNACGHPNSLIVGSNMVTSHIELLILNVFAKFS